MAGLLGHVELYGRDNPSQAVGYYEQLLANQPPGDPGGTGAAGAEMQPLKQLGSQPAGTNSCGRSTTGPAEGSVSEGSTGGICRTQRQDNSDALAGVDPKPHAGTDASSNS